MFYIYNVLLFYFLWNECIIYLFVKIIIINFMLNLFVFDYSNFRVLEEKIVDWEREFLFLLINNNVEF